MARYITSKTELKDYIKKELGCEYNKIELSDTQLENIVDITVQKYTEFAHDGLVKKGYLLPINKDQQDYIIGDDSGEPDIFDIVKIYQAQKYDSATLSYSLDESSSVINIFNRRFYYSFVDQELFNSYFDLYNSHFKDKISFQWNEPNQTLHLNEIPGSDDVLALETYQYYSDKTGLYNKIWLKEYSTAKARLSWGRNLMKMSNVTLAGGASINYEGIISEAKEDIEKLEEDLKTTWSRPLGVQIG